MIDAPCQLLFLERQEKLINLDLVTVEPVERGSAVVPPGTTVAVGIALDESAGGGTVLAMLERWADDSAIIQLGLTRQPGSLCLSLQRGNQRVTLEARTPAA